LLFGEIVMQFKNRQPSPAPELNLVPMLDVLMTVLTFFIVISMTLTSDTSVNVALPGSANSAPRTSIQPDPLIVQMNGQGQILVNNQPITEDQLGLYMQSYLAGNAAGVVVLQAAPQLPYEQVVQLLGNMKEIGGDRVSIAID
jgi:biopolymer transport protein ExbD